MVTNPSVQRLVGGTRGFPDLRVPQFDAPPFPADMVKRFPSLVTWLVEFREQHRAWEGDLQRALDRAFQELQAAPSKTP